MSPGECQNVRFPLENDREFESCPRHLGPRVAKSATLGFFHALKVLCATCDIVQHTRVCSPDMEQSKPERDPAQAGFAWYTAAGQV